MTKILPALNAHTVAIRDAYLPIYDDLARLPRDRLADDRSRLLRDYSARAFGWLITLAKLHLNMEFQAYAAAARGLLEIAVDVRLLHGDDDGDAAEKMRAWAVSAHHQYVSRTVKRYEGTVDQSPEVSAGAAWLQSDVGMKAAADRALHWTRRGKNTETAEPYHPSRWSGLDLAGMLTKLRKEPGCRSCNRVNLDDFYDENNAPLNWYLHGSGFAGLAHVPAEELDQRCADMLWKTWCVASVPAAVATHHFRLPEDRLQQLDGVIEAGLAAHRKLLVPPVGMAAR